MKAARIFGPNDIRYVDIDIPKISDEDVLIKVKCAGVCGTDLAIFSGNMPYLKSGATTYPITPGHEWSGEVVEIGKMVKSIEVGDRVTGDVSIGCGKCKVCLEGDYNLCPYRQEVGSFHNKDGGYAEYISMPERHTYKLPDNLSFEEGAMTEPSATVVYTVERTGIQIGDVVAVQGTGSIGILAAQASKAKGAVLTVLIGRNDYKLKLAKKVGIDVTINCEKENLVNRIMELTDGRRADVVIEASGAVSAILESSKVVRLGGRIGVVGIYENLLNGFDMSEIVLKDITLSGTLASPRVFPRTLKMMANGSIKCEPLITHRFQLSEVEKAFKAMSLESATRIKIMLMVG